MKSRREKREIKHQQTSPTTTTTTTPPTTTSTPTPTNTPTPTPTPTPTTTPTPQSSEEWWEEVGVCVREIEIAALKVEQVLVGDGNMRQDGRLVGGQLRKASGRLEALVTAGWTDPSLVVGVVGVEEGEVMLDALLTLNTTLSQSTHTITITIIAIQSSGVGVGVVVACVCVVGVLVILAFLVLSCRRCHTTQTFHVARPRKGKAVLAHVYLDDDASSTVSNISFIRHTTTTTTTTTTDRVQLSDLSYLRESGGAGSHSGSRHQLLPKLRVKLQQTHS